MDARRILPKLMLCVIPLLCAANYRTTNFIISADSAEFAKQVGDAAEVYRKNLAHDWLGYELPRWERPCPIEIQENPRLPAGGATTFDFMDGTVVIKSMVIQGNKVRILDSVLPHEITHTVFAFHFRRPLPRWADEGACTTVEHPVEKNKQKQMLIHFLHNNRGIAFSRMFAMKEYPSDIMPLYAQGFTLSTFLISQGGKQKFIKYIEKGLETDEWIQLLSEYYAYPNLLELQTAWLSWVSKGMREEDLPSERESKILVASSSTDRTNAVPAVRQTFASNSTPAQAKNSTLIPLGTYPRTRPKNNSPLTKTENYEIRPTQPKTSLVSVPASSSSFSNAESYGKRPHKNQTNNSWITTGVQYQPQETSDRSIPKTTPVVSRPINRESGLNPFKRLPSQNQRQTFRIEMKPEVSVFPAAQNKETDRQETRPVVMFDAPIRGVNRSLR